MTSSILPLPPQGVLFIDPVTGGVSPQWQNYLLMLESSLTGGFAPLTAKYWLSTSDSELTDETNIGALSTGYLKITTAAATAVPSSTTTIPVTDLTGVLPIANGGTASGTALSGSSIAISNGTAIVQGAAGTTTTLLHGNAAGAPTYSAVSLTADVSGDLPFANLAQGSALSVLGVTGNATADNASIAAGADNQVLRRSGTAVAFGAVNLASTDAVTGDLAFANLAQGSALSVLGVTGNATADNASIAAGTDGHVVRRSGTAVAFGTVATAGLADAAVTYAKIQNVTDARLLGRSSGSAGPPIEVTVGTGLSLSAGALTASGTAGAMTLIGSAEGTNTTASATNVATFAISGLTVKDTLLTLVFHASVTQQTDTVDLYNSTDSVALVTNSNGAAIAAGVQWIATTTIGVHQSATTAVQSLAPQGSSAAGASTRQAASTFTTAWTSPWTLALRTGAGGVTAGGTYQYRITVFKVAGQ